MSARYGEAANLKALAELVFQSLTALLPSAVERGIDLIEKRAVDIIGPDPADIGGIAELKWVAEYADLHGILMAPHGIIDGAIGLAVAQRLQRLGHAQAAHHRSRVIDLLGAAPGQPELALVAGLAAEDVQ